jgi:hypothetical protein
MQNWLTNLMCHNQLHLLTIFDKFLVLHLSKGEIMSLGVVIKGPEGVVLAADSRVTLAAGQQGQPAHVVNFDNASKFLSFASPHDHVGVVTYGVAVIGNRTASSLVPEFEQTVLSGEQDRLSVQDYSEKLSSFFMERWQNDMPRDYQGPDMTFIVGGYDEEDAYGKVFLFSIPGQTQPEPRNADSFGMTWGGQLQVASRIIHGYDPNLLNIMRNTLNLDDGQIQTVVDELKRNLEFPIPYEVLPLQDCIDLAIFLIRSTITAQRLAVGVRGVGGLIEVAVIARTKSIEFVQKKEIRGEIG